MEQLTLWLSVRCALEARKQQRAGGQDPDLGAFGRLCRSLSALRRGKQAEQRLEFQAERLELEKKRLDLSLGEGSQTLDKLFWEWTERPEIREKLFPKPPSPEEQMREYKRILGMDPNKEAPAEAFRRKQCEKRAAELQQQMAELEQQEAELERRKEAIERKKAEIAGQEAGKTEVSVQSTETNHESIQGSPQSLEACADEGPPSQYPRLRDAPAYALLRRGKSARQVAAANEVEKEVDRTEDAAARGSPPE
jgi:hypothetical protein